jgi:hypothetical protein
VDGTTNNLVGMVHQKRGGKLRGLRIKREREEYVLPLARKSHTPTTHSWPNLLFFSEKEGLLFSLIDHPARPIGRGGSNQRELLASPDSPSPRASLATLILPVGRAVEAQRQSRRNAGGANSG